MHETRALPYINIVERSFCSKIWLSGIVMSAGLLTLLVAPTVWSGYSVIYDTKSSFPTAGPNAKSDFGDFANARGIFPGGNGNGENQARGQSDPGSLAGGFGGFAGVFGGGSAQTDPALISYLEA